MIKGILLSIVMSLSTVTYASTYQGFWIADGISASFTGDFGLKAFYINSGDTDTMVFFRQAECPLGLELINHSIKTSNGVAVFNVFCTLDKGVKQISYNYRSGADLINHFKTVDTVRIADMEISAKNFSKSMEATNDFYRLLEEM